MSALLTAPTIADLLANHENCDLTVADAVWVGTALGHYLKSSEEPIQTDAIVTVVKMADLTKGLEKSIYLHVNQHCVANRQPNSNRSRMLFETGRGMRRLFRRGDPYDPAREGAPTHPDWEKIPPKYRFLHRWYDEVWNRPESVAIHDPLLALAGSGNGMWDGLDADDYVASLRMGWEGRP